MSRFSLRLFSFTPLYPLHFLSLHLSLLLLLLFFVLRRPEAIWGAEWGVLAMGWTLLSEMRLWTTLGMGWDWGYIWNH